MKGGFYHLFFVLLLMKMKKFWILFSLFILPLVFYIFLSKGIYKYANLPILTEEVQDLDMLNNTAENTFTDHITVMCFLGNDITIGKGSLFNLNQTIYKRYYAKPFFQMVAVLPAGTEEAYAEVIKELAAFTDISSWKFIYSNKSNLNSLFSSLDSPYQLNEQQYSPYAFIVDKELRLRGRLDDEDTDDGKLYGYNMQSVAILKNKMKDDIDIIYYQLKKSAEKEKRRRREI